MIIIITVCYSIIDKLFSSVTDPFSPSPLPPLLQFFFSHRYRFHSNMLLLLVLINSFMYEIISHCYDELGNYKDSAHDLFSHFLPYNLMI